MSSVALSLRTVPFWSKKHLNGQNIKDMSSKETHKYGTNDGWHGMIEKGGEFEPEKDRYHLYLGFFCPFAHRVNLVRHIKHLTSVISLSAVRPYPKGDVGFQFDETFPDSTPDHLFNSRFLHQLYFRDDPAYKGKFSVPLLWDKKTNKVVNNESGEILRWLPHAFDSVLDENKVKGIELYPEELRAKIDELSPWILSEITLGVYKAGLFTQEQKVYEKNVIKVFAALNRLEKLIHSNGGPYILGKQLTELDLLTYPTAVRFDVAYVQLFKTNLGMLRHDYPVIHNWMKNLYWNVEGFKESTNFQHIKVGYTKAMVQINPGAVTPLGPYPDIKEGYESDWSKLTPGRIEHPKVLEAEKVPWDAK